ncbi:sugar kinase [Ekhidna sp.]|uniref:sugar kinase n=1 Tax=Ekhidna sp. TaxID=2608089 RepID=UPI0032977714
MEKKVVTFGEILLRLSTKNAELFQQSNELQTHYGGSEANVAVSLSRMGISASIVSAVPDNEIAEGALSTFRKHGVNTREILKTEEGRLGLYFLEQGAAVRGSKVIYDRGGSSFALLKKGSLDWRNLLKGSSWFHISGISPAVSQSAAEASIEATSIAKEMGLKVSVDLNFRNQLWKYGVKPDEVMPEIVKHADVLLGDPSSINVMLGTSIPTKPFYASADDLLPSYKVLKGEFPNLEHIAMTLRTVKSTNHNLIGGALFHDGNMYDAKTVDVTSIVERIGGGDAFMAGLIYGLITEKNLDYTINYAAIASVLKMTISGDFNFFTSDEIESYMQGDMQGKLKR